MRHELAIRRRFGRFTRQISGYALHRLLPGERLRRRRLVVRQRRRVRGNAAGDGGAHRSLPKRKGAVCARLRRLRHVRPNACRSCCAHSPLTMESINVDLVERLPGGGAQARRPRPAFPRGRAWLLVEMGGEDRVLAARACRPRRCLTHCMTSGSSATASLVTDPGAQAVLWRCRTDAAGLATRRADGAEAWGGWEDAAVPPERLGAYLRGLDELMGRYGLSGASYGHFGEGCMHMRIDFDLLSAAALPRTGRSSRRPPISWSPSAARSSGEHGDGRARSELLGRDVRRRRGAAACGAEGDLGSGAG